jgi:hypothetical protein
MNKLNMNRFTFLDVILATIFIYLALDLRGQNSVTNQPSDQPATIVYAEYSEEFNSNVNVSLTKAQSGDSLYTFCEQFIDGGNIKNCIRYIIFRNRDKFPNVLDSEDDFYLIEGNDYVIPVR